MPSHEFLPRSYLFVPGDRPDRFEKATASDAHRVILDLEDAVAPDDKARARAAVLAWLVAHRDLAARTLVRVNAADTVWFEEDLDMLAHSGRVGIMLSKAEPDSMTQTLARIGASTRGQDQGLPECVALVETVRGFLHVRALASLQGLSRLAFGSIDFAVDAGMTDCDDEAGMTSIRVSLALESRLAGLPAPIDGVSTGIDDETAGHAARHARKSGFGAKLCIHPRQVKGVNAAFAPTSEERVWAERVLGAFNGSHGAAVALDGKMIDKPIVARARQILSS